MDSERSTGRATEEWRIDTYGAREFSSPKHPDQLWCPFSSSSMGTRCPFPRIRRWGRKLIPPLQQC